MAFFCLARTPIKHWADKRENVSRQSMYISNFWRCLPYLRIRRLTGLGGITPHGVQARAIRHVGRPVEPLVAQALVKPCAIAIAGLQIGGQALAVECGQAIADQGRSDASAEKLGPDGDKGQVKVILVVWMIGSGTLIESRDPFGVICSKDRLIKFSEAWLILMMGSRWEPQGGSQPILRRIYFAVIEHHVNKGAEKIRMQPFPGIVIGE